MYAREVEGQALNFGVSGKLIRNVLVMYDRETESYWSQLLGEAIEGQLRGTKLEFLPSWMMTWSEWKSLHPETLALRKPPGTSVDNYIGYYQSDRTGIIPEHNQDDRLYEKEFIIGVELPDGVAIAYPFRVLAETPIINDDPAGFNLLVVFNREQTAGVVYDRIVAGQLLTFTPDPNDWYLLTDDATGSTWDAFSGLAIAGPLEGTQLTAVKSTSSFWFGWNDFHQDTLVYEAN